MSKKKAIALIVISIEAVIILILSAYCLHKHQQVKELININQELIDLKINNN